VGERSVRCRSVPTFKRSRSSASLYFHVASQGAAEPDELCGAHANEAEGQALLEELTGFATADRFVYEHRWAERDLVMWDNRSSMHRGRPFAEASFKRQLRRTTVCDMQHAAEALS
jgi:hypothetical protein